VFCRVPRRQPSGFTLVTATISVPAGAPTAIRPAHDRDPCRFVAVDAAHHEDTVRRRGVAEHDRPDGAPVDAVADREHRKEQGE